MIDEPESLPVALSVELMTSPSSLATDRSRAVLTLSSWGPLMTNPDSE